VESNVPESDAGLYSPAPGPEVTECLFKPVICGIGGLLAAFPDQNVFKSTSLLYTAAYTLLATAPRAFFSGELQNWLIKLSRCRPASATEGVGAADLLDRATDRRHLGLGQFDG
jgi:hypothetical protein